MKMSVPSISLQSSEMQVMPHCFLERSTYLLFSLQCLNFCSIENEHRLSQWVSTPRLKDFVPVDPFYSTLRVQNDKNESYKESHEGIEGDSQAQLRDVRARGQWSPVLPCSKVKFVLPNFGDWVWGVHESGEPRCGRECASSRLDEEMSEVEWITLHCIQAEGTRG